MKICIILHSIRTFFFFSPYLWDADDNYFTYICIAGYFKLLLYFNELFYCCQIFLLKTTYLGFLFRKYVCMAFTFFFSFHICGKQMIIILLIHFFNEAVLLLSNRLYSKLVTWDLLLENMNSFEDMH